MVGKISLILTFALFYICNACYAEAYVCRIQSEIYFLNNPSRLELLAAKEIRRYIYLRTGQLLPIHYGTDTGINDIAIGTMHGDNSLGISLAPQQYLIKTDSEHGPKSILIAGGDDIGTLYGAYRFI